MTNADGMVLLHWSEKTANPSAEDPLGLNLRVGARLGAQLLHCITSITPRARYYSFLTWCVGDYLDRVKGTRIDGGLGLAILWRERALTLGCVLDHGGQACEGGGLVGSQEAARVVAANATATLRLDLCELSKNPAWDAYKGSLASLGLFTATAEQAGMAADALADDPDGGEELTEDDLQLTDLGREIADLFGSAVRETRVYDAVAGSRPEVTPDQLREWGSSAGLCAAAAGTAPELNSLRQLFLQTGRRDTSQRFRHDSMVALLFLASEMAPRKIVLDGTVFANATYLGQAYSPGGGVVTIPWPDQLDDVVNRWRMFHAHHYLSVALEGLFVSVVRQGFCSGLGGFTLDDLLSPLESPHTTQALSRHLGCELPDSFLVLSPRDVAAAAGLSTPAAGTSWGSALDHHVTLEHAICEARIEALLRDRDILHTPEGTALCLLLAAIVTMRLGGWRELPQAEWLLNNVYDATEDITVPLVLRDLAAHYADWWQAPFGDLGKRVIQKFVVRQHETLAYDKSRSGGKVLFHTERGRVIGRDIPYDSIGVTNPRFGSAIQIIQDLGWVQRQADRVLTLTTDGHECLERQLAGMEEAP